MIYKFFIFNMPNVFCDMTTRSIIKIWFIISFSIVLFLGFYHKHTHDQFLIFYSSILICVVILAVGILIRQFIKLFKMRKRIPKD